LSLQHTVAHCNTLQHTCVFQSHAPHFWRFVAATHCNTQEHTATYCNGIQDIYVFLSPAPPLVKSHGCNMLQCTATRCNTLQHTATHCDIQRISVKCTTLVEVCRDISLQRTATHCDTLQQNATYTRDSVTCTTTREELWLQYTATHCNTLQHTATHCNTLQYSAAYIHYLVKAPPDVRVFGRWPAIQI